MLLGSAKYSVYMTQAKLVSVVSLTSKLSMKVLLTEFWGSRARSTSKTTAVACLSDPICQQELPLLYSIIVRILFFPDLGCCSCSCACERHQNLPRIVLSGYMFQIFKWAKLPAMSFLFSFWFFGVFSSRWFLIVCRFTQKTSRDRLISLVSQHGTPKKLCQVKTRFCSRLFTLANAYVINFQARSTAPKCLVLYLHFI